MGLYDGIFTQLEPNKRSGVSHILGTATDHNNKPIFADKNDKGTFKLVSETIELFLSALDSETQEQFQHSNNPSAYFFMKGLVIRFLQLVSYPTTSTNFEQNKVIDDNTFNEFLSFSSGGRKSVINVSRTISFPDEYGSMLELPNPIFEYAKSRVLEFTPYYADFLDNLDSIRITVKGTGPIFKYDISAPLSTSNISEHFRGVYNIRGYTAFHEIELSPKLYKKHRLLGFDLRELIYEYPYVRVPIGLIPINGLDLGTDKIIFNNESTSLYPLATGENALKVIIFVELEGPDLQNANDLPLIEREPYFYKLLLNSPVFYKFIHTSNSTEYSVDEILESLKNLKDSNDYTKNSIRKDSIIWSTINLFYFERAFLESQSEISQFMLRPNRSSQNSTALLGQQDQDDLVPRDNILTIDRSLFNNPDFLKLVEERLSKAGSYYDLNYVHFVNHLFSRDFDEPFDLLLMLNTIVKKLHYTFTDSIRSKLMDYVDKNRIEFKKIAELTDLFNLFVSYNPEWFSGNQILIDCVDVLSRESLDSILQSQLYSIKNNKRKQKLDEVNFIQQIIAHFALVEKARGADRGLILKMTFDILFSFDAKTRVWCSEFLLNQSRDWNKRERSSFIRNSINFIDRMLDDSSTEEIAVELCEVLELPLES